MTIHTKYLSIVIMRQVYVKKSIVAMIKTIERVEVFWRCQRYIIFSIAILIEKMAKSYSL